MTVPSTSASDVILNNIGCRAGYKLDDRSSVKDVICQLDGTWSAFPDCEKGVMFRNFNVLHLLANTCFFVHFRHF